MPKRLVFCFDGTWNRLSAECPTNVVMLAQMVRPVARDGTPQIVYYDEGIGTHTDWFRQRLEGAFGHGMEAILREAYRFLIFNYEPGDEIFAFGFSRGAFTARSFVGFIRHAGILDVVSANQIEKALEIYKNAPAGDTGEESPEGLVFRAEHCRGVCVSEADRDHRAANVAGFDPASVPLLNIRYVGVWDTVRALGWPEFLPWSKWANGRYHFHDAVLTSKIRSARHAVAIDEPRRTFPATLMGAKVEELNRIAAEREGRSFPEWKQPYMEKWFPGNHGSVGGGGSRRGLSDGALFWVLSGATEAGLELRAMADDKTYDLRPNPFEHLTNEATKTVKDMGPIGWIRRKLFQAPRGPGPVTLGAVSLAALRRWHADPALLPEGAAYRPATLAGAEPVIAAWQEGLAPQPEELREYTVQRGDSLRRIARRELGDAGRAQDIFALNRDRIEDPDTLFIGQVILLPPV